MFSMYQGGTHVEVFDAGTTKFCTTVTTTTSRDGNASSGGAPGACGDDDSSKKSSKSLFAASNNAQSALRQARNQRGVQWQISDARKTVNSRNKKYYESTAKGYVLQLENASIETVVQHSNTTASAKARQLTQPMVCAQIYVEKPANKFTIEFVFSEVETRRDRRRVER